MEKYEHIFLVHSGESSEFTTPSSGGPEHRVPKRDRLSHSEKIRREFENAWNRARQLAEQRTALSLPVKQGVYLEFESAPEYDLITKRLENIKAGIRLLNVRTVSLQDDSEQTITRATIYIPAGKEHFFLNKIKSYVEKETPKGKPKNEQLINSIENIRLALLESFWHDDPQLMPGNDPLWCEIWLRGDDDHTKQSFRNIAQQLGIEIQDRVLCFPERTVILAKVNKEQLQELIEFSPDIAEYRRAKETARFFLELNNKEQLEWVQDLLSRLDISENPDVAVTVLDTGANNGHPLLKPVLKDDDCHAVDSEWESSDHHGHGTLMCGLATYGDLQDACVFVVMGSLILIEPWPVITIV